MSSYNKVIRYILNNVFGNKKIFWSTITAVSFFNLLYGFTCNNGYSIKISGIIFQFVGSICMVFGLVSAFLQLYVKNITANGNLNLPPLTEFSIANNHNQNISQSSKIDDLENIMKTVHKNFCEEVSKNSRNYKMIIEKLSEIINDIIPLLRAELDYKDKLDKIEDLVPAAIGIILTTIGSVLTIF